MIFLQEMKCNRKMLELIMAKAWANSRSVSVDASGASEGLAIIWDPQILSLYDFHASHFCIQTTFHLLGTNIHGHLTNVYFLQETHMKLDLLNTLTDLNSMRRFSLWFCEGDLNMTTTLEEISRGKHGLEGDCLGFKDFISINQLVDLQTSNGTFTWTNKRSGPQHIASRLDRFIMTENAIHIGGDFHSSILPLAGSDH